MHIVVALKQTPTNPANGIHCFKIYPANEEVLQKLDIWQNSNYSFLFIFSSVKILGRYCISNYERKSTCLYNKCTVKLRPSNLVLRNCFQTFTFIFYPFLLLINKMTMHKIFQKGGRAQHRGAKWESWSLVEGFELVTFKPKLHEFIRWNTAGGGKSLVSRNHEVLLTAMPWLAIIIVVLL